MTDTGLRPRPDDPWWNESTFVTLRVPEADLLGILYHYFRPNQNTAMGGPVFFDPSGEELSTCLHNGWDWNMPIPDGADLFDFTLENGFSCRTVTPEQEFAFSYEGPGCRFELTFTAVVGPVGLTAHQTTAGMETYFAGGHYDHVGLVSGWMDFEGRRVEVDRVPGLRDRSWGPRRMLSSTPKPRGVYLYGQADERTAFQATVLSPLPADDDPVVGTTEVVRSGFLLRDGVVGALVSGERSVTERGPDGRPRREWLEAVDEHGRVLRADGTIRTVLRWPGIYGDVMAFWCYETWAFDGHEAAPGEAQEFFTSRGFRRYHRSLSQH